MKRYLIAIMTSVLMMVLHGCEKDNDDNSEQGCNYCVTAPEANATHDNSSAGVYKGIITGSSGTIVFYVGNQNNEIKALIAFDGKSTTLTSQSFTNWMPGEAINNALFKGVLDGENIEAILSIAENGLNPQVNLSIPGHTIHVAIFKETSQVLVKSFEGSYKGDKTGTLNILLAEDEYTVLTNGQVLTRRVKLSNGKIKFQHGSVAVEGTLSEDTINGEWNDGKEKGTWSAKRTL